MTCFLLSKNLSLVSAQPMSSSSKKLQCVLWFFAPSSTSLFVCMMYNYTVYTCFCCEAILKTNEARLRSTDSDSNRVR